ncbi:MAG: diaminopimelate decarboxylase [Lachnospiraceae bacterium]|nr:diaminopimelate decarboxylase [Lachnospiraceae bacterium]
MKKVPFIDKQTAEAIAAKIPTPFHVYDEAGIIENIRNIKSAFSWNSGFKEYFAVKALPNPFILKIMKEYGIGVDCSSLTELLISKAAGFSGDDIMFSSNETPEEDYVLAKKLGAIVNLDDFTHIDYYDKLCRLDETMSIRYNPGGVFTVSNSIMDNPQDAKYGMTKEQVFDAVGIMMERGVKHFGIHSFLVSNTVTNDYYPMLAEKLFELAKEVHERTGAHIAFVNLSGGVGIPYTPDDEPNDISAIGEGVRKVYEKIFVPAGMDDVAIYTEMGRYVTGPYGGLVTRAIHEKHIYREYIGVDACAANLMRPAMYGSYHHITVLGKEDEPCTQKYDIVGGLCENNDKFAIDRMMPVIEKGDLLFIHDTGAHGFSMGYNYNGKLRSAEVLLHPDKSFDMIRRAETPSDYLATFDFSDFVFE